MCVNYEHLRGHVSLDTVRCIEVEAHNATVPRAACSCWWNGGAKHESTGGRAGYVGYIREITSEVRGANMLDRISTAGIVMVLVEKIQKSGGTLAVHRKGQRAGKPGLP